MLVTKDIALGLHSELIARFGGADGLRDEALLESALNKYDSVMYYDESATIFDASAAIAFGLIKNHAFIDGNKRIGALVCELYLKENNYKITATEEEKYFVFYGVASGEISERQLSEWLKNNYAKK